MCRRIYLLSTARIELIYGARLSQFQTTRATADGYGLRGSSSWFETAEHPPRHTPRVVSSPSLLLSSSLSLSLSLSRSFPCDEVYELSDGALGAIPSLQAIGLLFGSAVGGRLADALGRRRAIAASDVTIVCASLTLACAPGMPLVYVGEVYQSVCVLWDDRAVRRSRGIQSTSGYRSVAARHHRRSATAGEVGVRDRAVRRGGMNIQ